MTSINKAALSAEDALLAEAGLTPDDFLGILAVYRSPMTGRIAVIARAPLHGSPLILQREPDNLYTVVPGSTEGTLTFFFDPVLKS